MQRLRDGDEIDRRIFEPALLSTRDCIRDVRMRRRRLNLRCARIRRNDFVEAVSQVGGGLAVAAGAIPRACPRWLFYYGGADTRVGVAEARTREERR